MFTGIVTHVAEIKRSQKHSGGLIITFAKPTNWNDLELGESVATNGVCLTVAAIRADAYNCHLIPETLAKTSFGLKVQKRVNLERALQAGERFGGHFVQGHVDCVGKVVRIDKSDGWRLQVTFPDEYQDLIIYKGSICLNGVALTVAETAQNTFTVALIPHTLENTTLSSLLVGDTINLEFDMLGKYIVNYLKVRSKDANSDKI